MRLPRFLTPRTTVSAHCDLPCGVYDPAQARIEAESVKAIPPSAGDDTALTQEILRAIAGIRYGSVEVTIHEGRVVQIECREKIRLGGEAPRRNSVRPIR